MSKKQRRAFEGFETSVNEMRMTTKMYFWIFVGLAIAHILLGCMIAYFTIEQPKQAGYFYLKFWLSSALNKIYPAFKMTFIYNGEEYIRTAREVYIWLQDFGQETTRKLLKSFLFSGLVYLSYPVFLKYFKGRADKQAETEFIRGSKIVPVSEFKKQVKASSSDLRISKNISLPFEDETRHVFAIGKPGAGKTQFFTRIIDQQQKRNKKAVIYDFKGDYTAKFYTPEHLLFNPLDERGLKWTVFNDISTKADLDSFVNSMIPEGEGEQKAWNAYARDLFYAILNYCYVKGKRTNKDVWETLILSYNELAAVMTGVRGSERALNYLQESKLATSVMSSMMPYVKCFEYMSDGDFSIKSYVNADDSKNIFITNYSNLQDTLRPVLSLFIDLLSKNMLSLPDDRNRRIYIYLDEFGTLHRLDSMISLMTASRSKGCSIWLAIQDYGQIVHRYGEHHTQSILNACSNNFIFAVSDAATAEKLSKKIGEQEKYEAEDHTSYGVAENKDGYSFGKKKKLEKTILPSELMEMRDLDFYCKFSNTAWTQDTLNILTYPDKTERIVLSDIINFPETTEKLDFDNIQEAKLEI